MTQPKILIVEDEVIIAMHNKAFLQKQGYTISGIVGSGQEAIRAAAEFQPDLILMDIQLAGAMDGVEAAQAIYTQLKIPVLFITAYADRITHQRAMDAYPVGFLVKPILQWNLLKAIQEILSR